MRPMPSRLRSAIRSVAGRESRASSPCRKSRSASSSVYARPSRSQSSSLTRVEGALGEHRRERVADPRRGAVEHLEEQLELGAEDPDHVGLRDAGLLGDRVGAGAGVPLRANARVAAARTRSRRSSAPIRVWGAGFMLDRLSLDYLSSESSNHSMPSCLEPSHDHHSPAGPPGRSRRTGARRRAAPSGPLWLAILATSLPMFMATLDNLVLTSALPVIQADLGVVRRPAGVVPQRLHAHLRHLHAAGGHAG